MPAASVRAFREFADRIGRNSFAELGSDQGAGSGAGKLVPALQIARYFKNRGVEFSVFSPDLTRLLIIWGAVDDATGESHGQGSAGCRVRFLHRACRRVP